MGKKLQTLTALSMTEAEYISLSSALHDQIPLIQLMKEVNQQGIDVKYVPPQVHCMVFEDNRGAIEFVCLQTFAHA